MTNPVSGAAVIKENPGAVSVAAMCFGVAVEVQCPDRYIGAVSSLLPTDSLPIALSNVNHRFSLETESGDKYRINRGHRCVARAQPLPAALHILQNEIFVTLAEYAKTWVFIHAGAVAWQDRVIILPGTSYAGKSTLVRSFVDAGALYYSDEYAVLDEHGCVHPFGVPISLRSGTNQTTSVFPKGTAKSPAIPAIVAFAKYRQNAVWRPRTLRPAQTLFNLIRHCVSIRRNPEFVLAVLNQVSLQAAGFAGSRGDASQFLRWLDR
jgi:hypothetical protein